jgi:hypothetical protein
MQLKNHIVGPSFGVAQFDCIKDVHEQSESILLSIYFLVFGDGRASCVLANGAIRRVLPRFQRVAISSFNEQSPSQARTARWSHT